MSKDLSEEEIQRRVEAHLDKTIYKNEYIPKTPFETQIQFLVAQEKEVLFGGGARGGKSVALLMGASQYVHLDLPFTYSALILRNTFQQLRQEGGLIDESHQWWHDTDAKWHQKENKWSFPSGAVIQFGYLDTENDRYNYQGSQYHFIAFDELTQFPERDYRFLFRSLSKNKEDPIPLRMRAATNPIGEGLDWVRSYFPIEERVSDEKRFIPSTFEDNPHLDQEQYRDSLDSLDPVTKKRLKDGDWGQISSSEKFDRDRARIIEHAPRPSEIESVVRFWDFAATEPTSRNPDPDYCVGVKMCRTEDHTYVILNVERFRLDPAGVERRIREVAERDGTEVPIVIEVESGGQSKDSIYNYKTRVLDGFEVHDEFASKSKEDRADPFASQWEQRNVCLVRAPWNQEFLDEISVGFAGDHDDQIDAASGAYRYLVDQIKVWHI